MADEDQSADPYTVGSQAGAAAARDWQAAGHPMERRVAELEEALVMGQHPIQQAMQVARERAIAARQPPRPVPTWRRFLKEPTRPEVLMVCGVCVGYLVGYYSRPTPTP